MIHSRNANRRYSNTSAYQRKPFWHLFKIDVVKLALIFLVMAMGLLAVSTLGIELSYASFSKTSYGNCYTSSCVDLYTNPVTSSAPVSQTVTIDVSLDDVVDLSDAQIEVTFDPAIVEVIDTNPSISGVQIANGTLLIPDQTIRHTIDNTTGKIEYNISLEGNKPGVSGSGSLATITFRCLAVGIANITFTKSVLSDSQSRNITHTEHNGQVICIGNQVTVTGKITLELRESNAGAQVCVDGYCITTAADGMYTLPNVSPNGTISVTHPNYLSTERTYASAPGSILTLPSITLLSGGETATGPAIVRAARADSLPQSLINPVGHYSKASTSSVLNGNATLFPQPMILQDLTVGDLLKIDLMVEDVEKLYGFAIELYFNPTQLQVRDVNPDESGIQVSSGELLDILNQQIVINEVNNDKGHIQLAVTQILPAEPKSGNGTLGTIFFDVLDERATNVRITNAYLADNTPLDPQQIPVTILPRYFYLPTIYR